MSSYQAKSSNSRGGNAQNKNKSSKTYQPGQAPYKEGQAGGNRRGGNNENYRGGGKNYKGKEGQKFEPKQKRQQEPKTGENEEQKKNQPKSSDPKSQLQDLQSLIGGGLTDPAIAEDDAIIEDDDAIVADEEDDEAIVVHEGKKEHPKAGKPLWMEDGERKKYTRNQILGAFRKTEELSFDLLSKDYMSVYSVFVQEPHVPINQETDLLKNIDMAKAWERPSRPQKRPNEEKKWDKNTHQNHAEEEDEDPDWIDFDPEKQTARFFGHHMEDEQRLREEAQERKKRKEERAAQMKEKALQMAKMEHMTEEDRTILEESKKEGADLSSLDPERLKQAQEIAAQLEQKNYSNVDSQFERNYQKRGGRSRDDEILNDDQLEALFSQMKKETQEKRMKEMKKMDFGGAAGADDDDCLGGLEDDDELGSRGEDDDQEGQADPNAGRKFGKVGDAAFLDDIGLDDEIEEKPAVKYFDDQMKQQLLFYRESKKQHMQENKIQSAEGNLQDLFKNFQVVTRQRNKIDLKAISQFDEDASNPQQSVVTKVFSQINPFAQYVVQDILEEKKASGEEKREWFLHESIFKKTPDQEVSEDVLRKTSAQMFSVYKYYENPNLQVKSPYYLGKDEYVEVKDLMPKAKFFDAPSANFENLPSLFQNLGGSQSIFSGASGEEAKEEKPPQETSDA